jgi:hypothetical protein
MNNKLPLGIMKQAVMKLDSALSDLHEIACDDDIDEIDKKDFENMSDYISNIIAAITIKASKEINEEEFIRENINMDEIEPYPGEVIDILDEIIK